MLYDEDLSRGGLMSSKYCARQRISVSRKRVFIYKNLACTPGVKPGLKYWRQCDWWVYSRAICHAQWFTLMCRQQVVAGMQHCVRVTPRWDVAISLVLEQKHVLTEKMLKKVIQPTCCKSWYAHGSQRFNIRNVRVRQYRTCIIF